jgi:hypothetical protein
MLCQRTNRGDGVLMQFRPMKPVAFVGDGADCRVHGTTAPRPEISRRRKPQEYQRCVTAFMRRSAFG